MGKISEFFNFDNIGSKIKNLAKYSCWITILLIWIAASISFIVLVSDSWTAYLWWIPLVSAVVGPFLVWIGSWAMYAFGEFVEDIHAMRVKERTTAEVKAKQEAEARIKREAEEKARREAETTAKREDEKKAMQIIQKKEKTLSEKLEYALMFQTDDGMVNYLKGLQDEAVQDILKSPQHLIREQIKNLLEHL